MKAMKAMKARSQSGVTMIEMMIGIVVGLIVLWGLSTVYVNTARGSRTNATANALNQDLRAVMDIMVGDIRRAGYWNTTVGGDNPFTAVVAFPAGTAPNAVRNLVVAANCVLYSYDASHAGGTAGTADAGIDFFGFRLNGTVVQTLDPNAAVAVTSGGCATNAQWQNLTDDRAITVTALTFDTIGSQCLAYTKTTYNPNDTTTFTTWPTTAGTGVACAAGASGAPVTYPALTNTFVETRQVNITLSATSIVDPTLTRTLTETVTVRNNRIIAP